MAADSLTAYYATTAAGYLPTSSFSNWATTAVVQADVAATNAVTVVATELQQGVASVQTGLNDALSRLQQLIDSGSTANLVPLQTDLTNIFGQVSGAGAPETFVVGPGVTLNLATLNPIVMADITPPNSTMPRIITDDMDNGLSVTLSGNTVLSAPVGSTYLTDSTGKITINSSGSTLATPNEIDLSASGALSANFDGQPLTLTGATGATITNSATTITYQSGDQTVTAVINPGSWNGQVITQPTKGPSTTQAFNSAAQEYGAIGATFGSSLGRILAGSNGFAQIGASTVLGSLGQEVGGLIAAETTPNIDVEKAINDLLSGNAILSSVEGQGAGAISAYLIGELFKDIGLTGAPAQIVQSLAGQEVAQIATNLINLGAPIYDSAGNITGNVAWNTGIDIGSSLTNIAAGFVGTELGSLVYTASTVQGSEGASVGSALGGVIGGFEIGETVLGVTIPGVGVLIGAFVGEILGGVLGDLFGEPNTSAISLASVAPTSAAGALLQYGFSPSLYQGGSLGTANSIGDAVTGSLNSILTEIGGTVSNAASLSQFTVGVNTDSSIGQVFYYDDNTTGARTEYAASNTSLQTVVDYSIIRELSEMVFSGGDPYMERAIDAALRTSPTPTMETLSGDLQIASDYETYEANKTVINALIEANPTSDFAAGWVAELAIAASMGYGTSVQGSAQDDTLGAVGNDKIVIGGGSDVNGDNYQFLSGDGQVTILNGVSTMNYAEGQLFLGAGLTYVYGSNTGNVSLGRSGEDLTLSVAGSTDKVTVEGWFADSFAQLNAVYFNNGQTIIDNFQIQYLTGEATINPYNNPIITPQTDFGIAGNNGFTNNSNSVTAGIGSDVLNGSGGDNVFITGGGDTTTYGGGGSDTYQFNDGGLLTIYNGFATNGVVYGSGPAGTLQLGAGMTLNQLSFSESGNDLVLNVANNGGKVTVKNWFAAGYAQLSSILTADGYTISYANGVFSTGPAAVDWIVTNGSVLNANSLFVNMAAGISATVDGSYNNIQAVNDALTIADADGTVDTIGGSGDAITVTSAGDTFYLSGANQTITTYNNGATIDIAAGSTVTVGGHYNTINVAAGATVTTSGTGNVITATGDVLTIGGPNGFTEAIGGSGDSIAFTSASDTIDLSGTSQTLTTTYATTINVGINSSATISGDNDTIADSAGATTSVYGAGDVLSLSGNNTIAVGNGTSVTIGNDVPGDVVNIYNNDAATVAGTGGYIGIVGTGVSLTASGENIGAYPGASFTLTGNNNTITDDAGVITYLYGSGNVLNLNGGDAIAVGSGTSVTINNDVAGDTVNIYNNNDVATVTGTGGYIGVVGTGIDLAASGETIGVSPGASFALWGNNDTITGASGASIDIERGTGDVFNATNDTIILAAGASVTINNNGTGSVLDFGAGITASQLIFGQSGNDLVIDVAGSSTQAIVKNWFSTPSARLQSIDTADGQQLSFVSNGTNFFTVGETDLYFRNAATGQLSVWRDDGVTAGGQSLTTGGAPFTIDAATTVVGTASNLYAQSGQDILFRNGAGTVSFAEFTSGGAEFGGGETLYNATVNLTVDSTAQFVGTNGTNFMAQGGHDLFIRGDGNQLLVWEFNNGTGQVVAGEYLYNSNGTPFTIDTATTVIGVGSNLLGQDGHDILTRNADDTVSITEFNSNGYAIVGGTFTYQGNALTMESAARFVGTNGTNFLGQYGYDLFFRYGTGQLLVWEVANGTAQITSGQYLLQPNGNGPYTIDTATTVIGVGSNLLGYNGQDILTHHGPETVSITEFDSNGDEITSSMLTYNGNNLTFDAETQFVGTNGMNFLGAGGHDLFFRYSTGQVVIWEYTSGTSQVTAGGYLFQADGVTPFTIDTATTIVGTGSNLLGDGGQDVLLRNAAGTISVAEFDSNGAELGSVSLYYPAVNLTVDNTAEFIGTNSTNFIGQGGHDLFFRGDSGQVLVWEFNNVTGQVTAGQYLYQSNGTAFTIDTATSIIGTGSNLLGQGGQDILTLNANLTVTMTEFNSSGVELQSGTLTYQGRALTDDAATKFVGTNGTNFLGQGGNDLFFRATSGQLLVWEVASGTTQIVAGEYLIQPNGTPFIIDPATTVASVGHDSADGSAAITLKYANGSTALLDVSSGGVVTAAPAGGLLDPLVLNLSGGTVQTTAMAGSGVTFDMVGDGATQQTGWITQGEGFLVADPSNAPIVSRAQMFSDLLAPGAGSGLAALATYDTNGDGKITAADSDFGDIKVWVPGAAGSAGSLYSLNQLGITGIDLQPTAIDAMNNGNEILNGFSFQYANGKTGQGAEVGFAAGPDIDPVSTTLTQLVQAMAGVPSSGATLNMPLLAANDQSLQSVIAAHH